MVADVNKAPLPAENITPPHNPEAEKYLLGNVLQNPEVLDDIIDIVESADFFQKAHSILFDIVTDMYNRGQSIDLVTVSRVLHEREVLEKTGGASYISSLVSSAIGFYNVIEYAQIVRDAAIRRRLMHVGGQIVADCAKDNLPARDVLESCESQIYEIADARSGGTVKELPDLLDNVLSNIESRIERETKMTGLPSGFVEYDSMSGGLNKTDLIILAGRPSMGKTAFALNTVKNIAVQANESVLVASLEMSSEQLTERFLCSWSHVEFSKIKNGRLNQNELESLRRSTEEFSEAPIYIDDSAILTPMDIKSRARRIKSSVGLGAIVIDYIQMMSPDKDTGSREQNISSISRSLKMVAKELDVPLICLAQLNRNLESREDKRPVLADLRESGAIEQDADQVVFLYRDDYYNQSENNPNKGLAEVIIAKYRNGPTGSFNLGFIRQFQLFANIERQ